MRATQEVLMMTLQLHSSFYKSMSWSTRSRERVKLGKLDSESPLLLREWPPETVHRDRGRQSDQKQERGMEEESQKKANKYREKESDEKGQIYRNK